MTSKPTWCSTCGCSTTSAFFSLAVAPDGRGRSGGIEWRLNQSQYFPNEWFRSVRTELILEYTFRLIL